MSHIRLTYALDALAYAAMARGAPAPVITTDIMSATALSRWLEEDIGMRPGELVRCSPLKDGLACMYNGVEIRYPLPAQPAEQGWREHFGPLAELLGD